jgi:phosphoinositide-3-kinase, regulatory subunit 4
MTYSKHGGKVLDAVVLENSHSVATSSESGSIHVWRVDSSSSGNPSVVKSLEPLEGPVQCLQHYTGDVASVLTYATQRGVIHSWDLRASREPFQYNVRPELGYPMAMVCSPDRNWMCVGTSRGFIGLWDIRYNVMCKLWRHSANRPISRLACAKASPTMGLGSSEGAYLFVASGKNEAAVWGVPEGGECLKCFRSVPMSASRGTLVPLPHLHDITIPTSAMTPFHGPHVSSTKFERESAHEPAVRALVGRISQSASSYVVTAGTDRNIRYWDLTTPNKCFTISGLEPAQPKSVYETPLATGLRGKLFLCYDSAVPSAHSTLQSQLPVREYRGISSPDAGFKVKNYFIIH